MDEPLSVWEKFQLFTHTFFCWCCRRFENQLHKISEALRDLAHELMAFERYQEIGMSDLSPEAKQKIMNAIRNLP